MSDVTGIKRRWYSNDAKKFVSLDADYRLTGAAFKHASSYWEKILDFKTPSREFEIYFGHLKAAQENNIFQIGGIDIKDHMNLYIIAKGINPDIYVESGVFTGSSLHAALVGIDADRVFGIDPVDIYLNDFLANLMVNPLIKDRDFADLTFEPDNRKKVAYFDDHIDTSSRLLSAFEKGFQYAIFDDSTGFEGIGQREYPALPTIGMLRLLESLQVGDTFEWALQPRGNYMFLKKMISGGIFKKFVRMKLEIDDEFMKKLHAMRECCDGIYEFPNLGEFLFSNHIGRLNTTTKYLVRFKTKI